MFNTSTEETMIKTITSLCAVPNQYSRMEKSLIESTPLPREKNSAPSTSSPNSRKKVLCPPEVSKFPLESRITGLQLNTYIMYCNYGLQRRHPAVEHRHNTRYKIAQVANTMKMEKKWKSISSDLQTCVRRSRTPIST